jgi:hypothetical protein
LLYIWFKINHFALQELNISQNHFHLLDRTSWVSFSLAEDAFHLPMAIGQPLISNPANVYTLVWKHTVDYGIPLSQIKIVLYILANRECLIRRRRCILYPELSFLLPEDAFHLPMAIGQPLISNPANVYTLVWKHTYKWWNIWTFQIPSTKKIVM